MTDLAPLDSRELFQMIEELRAKAIELGGRWAEAKSLHSDRKELLPCLLSEAQTVLIEINKASVAESKVKAQGSKAYQDRVEAMLSAERAARMIEVEYKATMESLKALTAVCYTRNSELKLARG